MSKAKKKSGIRWVVAFAAVLVLIAYLLDNCSGKRQVSLSQPVAPVSIVAQQVAPEPTKLPKRKKLRQPKPSAPEPKKALLVEPTAKLNEPVFSHSVQISELNDKVPYYTVTLNSEDSQLFYQFFYRMSGRKLSGYSEQLDMTNSNRAFALRCNHSKACLIHFYTTKNHSSTQLRYNTETGMIQLALWSEKDVSYLNTFFQSHASVLKTQEEIMVQEPGEESHFVPRAKIDCESNADSCVLEAYRDFQNSLDIR